MTNGSKLLSRNKYARTVLARFQEFLRGKSNVPMDPTDGPKLSATMGPTTRARKAIMAKPTVQTVPRVVDVPDGLNQTRPGTCHLTTVLFLAKPRYGPLAGGTQNPGVCAEYAGCRFAVP